MNADSNLPPWLIIVHRDEDTLYHNLLEAFASDPRVRVIKDRRRADQPAQAVPVPPERRHVERRLPITAGDEKIWQSLRFRLIHRDETLTVYQAGEPAEGAPPTPTTGGPKKRRTQARDGAPARQSGGSPRRGRPGPGER